MAIAAYPIPYGLRSVKIRPIAFGTGVRGASIVLPLGQTFSFSEAEDFEELRGDDSLAATHGSGPTVDWELSSGALSLEAYAAIAGGAILTTGVTPNVKKTYTKLTTDARPYFEAEGQAISDSGGDFHIRVLRCKATDNLEGSLEDGSFWITGTSGKGLAESELSADLGKVYQFIHNETAIAIT